MNSHNPIIHTDGTQEWWLNGQRHRIDGPAIIWPDGTHSWYVNDRICYTKQLYQKAVNLSDEDMIILLLKYEFK